MATWTERGLAQRADPLRRLATAPYAPAVAGALLAAAAVAQAIAAPVGHGRADGADLQLAFVLLALFTTLPLGLLWAYPAAAAVAVCAAAALSLSAFHALTVAGLIAQLILLYRLGRSGSQLLAAGLALPFLVLAAGRPAGRRRPGSPPCCWPRWARPRRGPGPPGGPAARPRSTAPPARSSPARCSSTRRAGNAPASPASCTTSWPTTFP